eukprot:TRINITY_DN13577_c0_g1_i2.p1 TRINITY_DN13577_c0_g1~~TRINITY_DN13577_c0_g1_i2.p1  ORF type:complete len:360 (+),score=52.30 TRINITY_DN13577_c0_g1_i2:365-1444(+)
MPNYSDGDAERAVGYVLRGLFSSGQVRRDEVIISTKVGNVVGSSLELQSARECPDMARVRSDCWHCLNPAWIEEELTRSLQRLELECVDVLLLHCPEFASKAHGVNMDEVYRRLSIAFVHLETEVSRGRIARYGVSAAFYPLRRSDPEHLLLERVMDALPPRHHFEVLQFPFNFAEPQALWMSHTARDCDGSPLSVAEGFSAEPLLQMAKRFGLATLVNRPLDGIYQELRGVLRFASELPFDSALQPEDADALEAKLTACCALGIGTNDDDVVTGELAAKSVKVIASLKDLDCVLVGMRQVAYVAGIARMFELTPCIDPQVAKDAVHDAHNSIGMWFCTADQDDDHGTAKDWRLPMRDS